MAAKLNIPWPAVQEETTKSHYDRKRLPVMKKMGKPQQLVQIWSDYGVYMHLKNAIIVGLTQ